METSKTSEQRLKVPLTVHISLELKEFLEKAAEAENIPVNQFVARLLAKHIRRPELAFIPRKKMGRPRKALSTSK